MVLESLLRRKVTCLGTYANTLCCHAARINDLDDCCVSTLSDESVMGFGEDLVLRFRIVDGTSIVTQPRGTSRAHNSLFSDVDTNFRTQTRIPTTHRSIPCSLSTPTVSPTHHRSHSTHTTATRKSEAPSRNLCVKASHDGHSSMWTGILKGIAARNGRRAMTALTTVHHMVFAQDWGLGICLCCAGTTRPLLHLMWRRIVSCHQV